MTLAFDHDDKNIAGMSDSVNFSKPHSSLGFSMFKRSLDFVFAVPLVLLTGLCAVVLLILNPFFNPGKLFFVQKRMGKNCLPFNVYKFRSMTAGDGQGRSADCGLEVDRITRLGHWIRRLRVDELPQILNVLKGDMSLIGPRPDAYHHAEHFIQRIPGYAERHSVRPGISGYAQTEVGYVEGTDATRKKVAADLYYIQNRGFRLESWIVWRSLVVIVNRAGS